MRQHFALTTGLSSPPPPGSQVLATDMRQHFALTGHFASKLASSHHPHPQQQQQPSTAPTAAPTAPPRSRLSGCGGGGSSTSDGLPGSDLGMQLTMRRSFSRSLIAPQAALAALPSATPVSPTASAGAPSPLGIPPAGARPSLSGQPADPAVQRRPSRSYAVPAAPWLWAHPGSDLGMPCCDDEGEEGPSAGWPAPTSTEGAFFTSPAVGGGRVGPPARTTSSTPEPVVWDEETRGLVLKMALKCGRAWA